jgi:hypothetical protein
MTRESRTPRNDDRCHFVLPESFDGSKVANPHHKLAVEP